MKFNTCYTYENVKKGFKSTNPSLTVPGQAYGIAHVVERIRAGLPVQVLKSGFNPDGYPKFDDLTTLDQFKKIVQGKVQRIDEKIKAIKAKKEAGKQSDKADDKAV